MKNRLNMWKMLYKEVAHVTSGLLMWLIGSSTRDFWPLDVTHWCDSLKGLLHCELLPTLLIDARVALFSKLSDRLLKIWLTQKLASLNTSAFFLTNYKPLGTANLTAVRDEIEQYRVKFFLPVLPRVIFLSRCSLLFKMRTSDFDKTI